MKKSVKTLLILCVLLIVVGVGCVVGGYIKGVTAGDVQQLMEEYSPMIHFDGMEEFIEEDVLTIEENIIK